MWARFRNWKHTVAPLLVALAYLLLHRAPEGSTTWFIGLGLAGFVGLAYVIEEVSWNIGGGGRPCAACGHRVRMKSFRIRNSCPGCGQQL